MIGIKFTEEIVNLVEERIAILDKNGVVIMCSKAWRADAEVQPYYGGSFLKKGESFLEYTAPDSAQLLALKSLIDGTQTEASFEYISIPPSGDAWLVTCACSTLKDQDGPYIFLKCHESEIPGIKIMNATQTNESPAVLNQSRLSLISKKELQKLTINREDAREQERKRIARELHDDLGQILSYLKLTLSGLEFKLSGEKQDVKDILEKSMQGAQRAIDVVRTVTTKLRPAVLDSGLKPAIEWIIHEYFEQCGLKFNVIFPAQTIPLNERQSLALFRIVQECLHNIMKHSKATAVNIYAHHNDGEFWLSIIDNGVGFDMKCPHRSNAYGLMGIRERAMSLGADISIFSGEGHGTSVKLKMRLDAKAEGEYDDSGVHN